MKKQLFFIYFCNIVYMAKKDEIKNVFQESTIWDRWKHVYKEWANGEKKVANCKPPMYKNKNKETCIELPSMREKRIDGKWIDSVTALHLNLLLHLFYFFIYLFSSIFFATILFWTFILYSFFYILFRNTFQLFFNNIHQNMFATDLINRQNFNVFDFKKHQNQRHKL